MYPLDQGVWGPITRITHLRDELAKLADLEVIAAERKPRRGRLLRYAFAGRLRGLEAIYVENSSTLPSESDIAFLGLARLLGIPILTYVRDAQYLFPEYFAATTWKRRVARALFRPSVAFLRFVSTWTAYPSIGLARATGDKTNEPLLLPPGSPPPAKVPRRPGADHLLFVGGMQYAAHGLELLVGAVEEVRSEGFDVKVLCVSRPGEEPPDPRPSWMRIERGATPQVHALLPDVIATIQPRLRSPYNDLAVPIKVMEYLSYGRPLIVTNCTEQARIVNDAEAGLVVEDTIPSMAAGLRRLLTTDERQIERWSGNALAAATAASWRRRAQRIVQILSRVDA